MSTAEIKGNLLILNIRNELIYNSGNHWAVLGAYATKDLESALMAWWSMWCGRFGEWRIERWPQ